MTDEWRLQVDLRDGGHARALIDYLRAYHLQHDLLCAFHERVAVTRDGARVFFYAGNRQDVERAGDLVKSTAKNYQWVLEMHLSRWHPIAEKWERPEVPLPKDDAARAAEHRKLLERERSETALRGYAEIEVRVELPSHRDAARVADQLQRDGVPAIRRWRYLLIGAADEDAARALAEHIREQIGHEGTVNVEGTLTAARAAAPSPFAVFRQIR